MEHYVSYKKETQVLYIAATAIDQYLGSTIDHEIVGCFFGEIRLEAKNT